MALGTHIAFASVLYLGGATLFDYKPDGISWALATSASLLPDIGLPPPGSPPHSKRCQGPPP